MQENLEVEIGKQLISNQYKLVVAESCTGGLISHRITNVSGSSEYYLGGICAYAYEAKRTLLGVKPETLINFGAVSRETVVEMSNGVRTLFSKETPREQIIGISVSGIAGPGGGMPGKPVGLVWISLSSNAGTWAWKKIFDGTRIQNKEYSSDFALVALLKFLNGAIIAEE